MNVERLWKVAKRCIFILTFFPLFGPLIFVLDPKKLHDILVVTIGGFSLIYGFSEIQSGRWTGVIWVLFGPVIVYLWRRELRY